MIKTDTTIENKIFWNSIKKKIKINKIPLELANEKFKMFHVGKII